MTQKVWAAEGTVNISVMHSEFECHVPTGLLFFCWCFFLFVSVKGLYAKVIIVCIKVTFKRY